jgi:hypothetical protein
MILSESAAMPNRVRAVQYATEDLFSAMVLRRRIPSVLLGNVASYNSCLDMGALYARFASTRQHGYVLSRHPLFAKVVCDAGGPYEHVYSLAQRQHARELRHIEKALQHHILFAEML